MSQFESDRTNPFAFKHLKPCHSLQDLTKLTDPKVVLATQPDLQSGFAKDLFVQWCQDPKNCVIFTQRTGQGTLARLLIDRPETKAVAIDVKKRVPLEGAELEQYLAKKVFNNYALHVQISRLVVHTFCPGWKNKSRLDHFRDVGYKMFETGMFGSFKNEEITPMS